MFPTHPETVCTLSAFDYQQLLRDAEKERIAASTLQGGVSTLNRSRALLRSITFGLGRASQRLIDVRRPSPATSLSGDQAHPAGHGI